MQPRNKLSLEWNNVINMVLDSCMPSHPLRLFVFCFYAIKILLG